MENIGLSSVISLYLPQYVADRVVQTVYNETSREILLLLETNRIETFEVSEDRRELYHKSTIELKSLTKDHKAIKIILQRFYDKIYVLADNNRILVIDTETQIQSDLNLHDITKILDIRLSPNEEHFVLVTDSDIKIYDKFFKFKKDIKLEDEGFKAAQASIAWRFDSEFFAVIYGASEGNKCLTFDVSGVSQISNALYHPDYPKVTNVFEKFRPDLNCIISWASNGSIICGVKENFKLDLWEKNCLEYDSCDLSDMLTPSCVIKELVFYHTGRQLFVLSIDDKADITILTVLGKSNAKWHVKSQQRFHRGLREAFYASNTLYLIFNNGTLLFVEYDHHARLYTKSDTHLSLVLFNMEKNLHITPINRLVIPPPLYFTKITHDLVIDTFDLDFYILVVRLSSGEIVFYQFDESLSEFQRLECEFQVQDNMIRDMRIVKGDKVRLYYISEDVLEEDKKVTLKCVEFNHNGNVLSFDNEAEIDVTNEPRILRSTKSGDQIIYLNELKELLWFDIEVLALESLTTLESDNPIIKFDVPDVDKPEENVYIDSNDNLFRSQTKISSDVGSFIISNRYLVYTKTDNSSPYDKLCFYDLSQTHIQNSHNLIHSKDSYWIRAIEKNSRLVAVADEKIIMEMPRGNLETINHRILTLHKVKELIETQSDYKEAFSIIRKNRMKSNVIVDIDFERFIANISTGSFVTTFISAGYLDLFVMGLDDSVVGDEMRYLFSESDIADKHERVGDIVKGQSKVNFVCETIIQFLLNHESEANYKHEMVLYSKKSPPELERGLNRIRYVKQTKGDVVNKKPPHLNKDKHINKHEASYKEILKYFCWLVDANQLYKFALALYDLELALMIAEFTQMDPKEYLPYIEELRNITNEIDFKARVCSDMNRYDLAIEELAKGTDIQKNQAITLVQEKHLYVKGVSVFNKDPIRRAQVAKLYGTYLYSIKNYKHAVFWLSPTVDNKSKVMTCFERVMDWENGYQYISKHYPESLKDFCEKMLATYKKLKAYDIVAQIYVKLNHPVIDAIRSYILSRNYRKIRDMLMLEGADMNLIDQVTTEVKICVSVEENRLVELKRNVVFWMDRLDVLQKLKIHARENNVELQGFDQSVSDATSVYSALTVEGSESFSVMTGVSKFMKKKPKNLRKRKYKKNSPFEEEWLVESLNSVSLEEDECKRIVHFLGLLVFLGLEDDYNKVKCVFTDFYKYWESKRKVFKTVRQVEFEKSNPEVYDLYGHIKEFDSDILNRNYNGKEVEEFVQRFEY